MLTLREVLNGQQATPFFDARQFSFSARLDGLIAVIWSVAALRGRISAFWNYMMQAMRGHVDLVHLTLGCQNIMLVFLPLVKADLKFSESSTRAHRQHKNGPASVSSVNNLWGPPVQHPHKASLEQHWCRCALTPASESLSMTRGARGGLGGIAAPRPPRATLPAAPRRGLPRLLKASMSPPTCPICVAMRMGTFRSNHSRAPLGTTVCANTVCNACLKLWGA